MKLNIKDIAVGDCFSEEAHYIVKELLPNDINFLHLESGKIVTLGHSYVTDLLNTSDQYFETVKVTREDKKDSQLGIKSIFENIKSSEVFTVVFTKQPTNKTKKEIEKEKTTQREAALALIEKARSRKKSMAVAYEKALSYIQNNPIKDYIEGEDRVLRGYKKQFVSRDGKYRCIDLDIKQTEKETGERLVNINTIKELIFNGVKYIVES